ECSGGSCTHPADKGGTLCRPAAGECDIADDCANGNSMCPADAKDPNGPGCSTANNPCTVDQCNGSSAACQHPAGNLGAVCRSAAAGGCDVAETCTGSSATCPSNGFADSSTQCAGPQCNQTTDFFTPASFCTGSGAT